MIHRTNINLSDYQGHIFTYCVEFEQSNQKSAVTKLPSNDNTKNISGPSYVHWAGAVHFKDTTNLYTPLLHYGNDWYINDRPQATDAMPRGIGYKYHTAKVLLYCPQFSVDTYEKGTKYAFTISTFVHGKRVYLGSYIVDRKDAVAAPKVLHYQESDYYECIPVTIIDPRDMMWSDDWAAWRHTVCGEPFIPSIGNHQDTSSWNSDGANLYFTLYAIEELNGQWVKMEGYDGGQNCVTIGQTVDDFFGFDISLDDADITAPTHVCGKIRCNYEYANVVKDDNIIHNFNGWGLRYDLPLYFYETYGVKLGKITANLVIKDEDNIYKSVEMTKTADEDCTQFVFDREVFAFDNWSGYKEGIKMQGSISMYDKEGGETIYILSNEIALTPEKFALFVKGDLWDVPFVNLVDLDEEGNLLYSEEMKVYNINTVNKIEQTVVQMDRPDNSKANIIMPVFFKARDTQNVIIHPAVTEVIALNLDMFKSKVSTFILQVEGQPFTEIGRSDSGVLFRVVGNMLPNALTEGTYYILNENGDMVTSGHYTYEA